MLPAATRLNTPRGTDGPFAIGVGVGLGVGVEVGLGVGVGVGIGLAVGLGVGVGLRVGAAKVLAATVLENTDAPSALRERTR